MATVLVLEKLLTEVDRDPVWGLEICRSADLGSGTVYTILGRLRERGWVSVEEEEPDVHPGRPARRFYRFTTDGRRQAEAVLMQRQLRLARDGIR